MDAERFDLIVKFEEEETQQDYFEKIVIEHVEDSLKKSNSSYFIKETEYFNIFMVEFNENNIQTAVKIANSTQPRKLEAVPIESVVVTRPDKIQDKIIDMSKKRIKTGEKFAIDCNIRGRYIKTKEEFIQTLTRELIKLKGQPDESNPDWVIHIEVLGESTGISVLKKHL